MTETILGIWNPTPHTLKRFEVIHNASAKDGTLLELGICTIHNQFIRKQHSHDMQKLLSDWQILPPFGQSIAFLRPISDDKGAISMYSFGHIAVTCIGVIDNLSYLQEELIPDIYQLDTENVAEILCYLFNSYLDLTFFSPVEMMQVMKRLKGHFAIMALFMNNNRKWLIVGSNDYPLAIGKGNNHTAYFSTDTEILTQFSQSKFIIHEEIKPSIFHAISSQ